MIKRTFYNLPPEKREKIIDVTRKEFQKGHKQKITINTVIKKAGISRGSFYQYFDDKLDLVELVTDDMISRIVDFIRDELMLNGGDIFEIPIRFFDEMVADKLNRNELALITDDDNQNNALISDYLRYRAHKPNFYEKFEEYIDKSSLSLSDDEDVKCVIFMMFDAVKAALENVIRDPSSQSKERVRLYRKTQILKAGAMA